MLISFGIEYMKKLKFKLLISVFFIFINVTFALVSIYLLTLFLNSNYIMILLSTLLLSLFLILSYQIYKYIICVLKQRIKVLKQIGNTRSYFNQKIEFIELYRELGINYFLYKINDDVYESNLKIDDNIYNIVVYNKYILKCEVVKWWKIFLKK